MKMNNALGPLCHALALTEIGLDPTAIREWAVDRPPAFRRNWYFAEAGLIDHADPSDKPATVKAPRRPRRSRKAEPHDWHHSRRPSQPDYSPHPWLTPPSPPASPTPLP